MTTSNVTVPEIRVSTHEYSKRVMDLALSFVLLILLIPLFMLVAVLIKVDSKGPVLFWQKRIGKDGEPFLILKFRTMHVDAHPYERCPKSDLDPRLTGIGRLLRRFSIDELPQLLNVIRGDMSLVGPRPEMPFIVETYGTFERQRLKVKPGITGLWQISAARAMPIHENLQYDLLYLESHSFGMDVMILLRTCVAVVRGIGAT